MLMVSAVYADFSYLEVTETVDNPRDNPFMFVRIAVTDKQDASNQLADVVATWFSGTTYTAVFHIHRHYAPDEPNRVCPVSPMKQGDTHKGTLETIVDEQHELPETVVIPTDTIEKADKAVKDAKLTRWFKDKPTKDKSQ